MPKNKKQLSRLVKLVAELKENRYPSATRFAAKLCAEDINENNNTACTAKTIQRDIKVLKENFGAPIDYDYKQQGYYLTHHGWNFECPLFDERELLAAIFGARIAENILPSPIRDEVRKAVDNMLTENNPDFLDSAQIDSLIISSGLQVSIDPDIFNVVFEGWQKRLCIDIEYQDISGKKTRRTIEPHVLAYLDYSWLISGICRLRATKRTFAVHRILSARLTEEHFEPDRKLVDNVNKGLPFDVIPVTDIVLECDSSILHLVKGRPLHKDQTIEDEGNVFTLYVPSMTDFELIHWIVQQKGKAKLLRPAEFKTIIADTARTIMNLHQ